MKKVLLYFVLLMALGLAGIVAVVSVTGLMKIFAGAGTMGLIFFIIIETGKIFGTSAIHTYKDRIEWYWKSLMMLFIGIAMAVTSLGIYGFLSNSYKQATDSMSLTNSKVEMVVAKKMIAEEDKASLNIQIDQKRERIQTLTELRKSQEARMDSLINRGQNYSANKIQKAVDKADENIDKADTEITLLNDKINIVNDSLSSYEIQILELEHNSEGASELNSLKYLSDVTGMSMDDVMKWFILLLIIIGDPMAVLFVIFFNKIVNFDSVEGLPMDDLIGDGPKVNPVKSFSPAKSVAEELIPVIPMGAPDGTSLRSLIDTITEPEEEIIEQLDDKLGDKIEEEIVEEPIEEEIIEQLDDKLHDKLHDKPVVEDIYIPSPTIDELVEEEPMIDEVIENTPEEQIEENIEEIKELKREPIVPRGKIIDSDLTPLIDRGFSVPVPDPKGNTILIPRRRNDELGND